MCAGGRNCVNELGRAVRDTNTLSCCCTFLRQHKRFTVQQFKFKFFKACVGSGPDLLTVTALGGGVCGAVTAVRTPVIIYFLDTSAT